MGFDVNGTRFLLDAKASGVNFEKVAMIGRQKMHLMSQAMTALFNRFGYTLSETDVNAMLNKDARFAEPFLEILGAEHIDSYDASDYERATVVHDMNIPVPDTCKNKYTVVIDGGSLEHIFNFPVAVKNCMEMVKPGGYYLGITPANNFMGHGFYQFSPELYYRVFCPANGFITEVIYIFEDIPNAQWVQLTDPDVLGKRLEMVNSKPAYMLIRARRIEEKEIFKLTPQQSDYSATWKREGS